MNKHTKTYKENNDKTEPYTDNRSYRSWRFGTVNIRSGKEKDEGSKIYTIAKQVAQLGLTFCCLQEVKYRNKGNKVVELDTGEKFEYHWYGMKKRRTAGVGILIKCDRNVEIDGPDSEDPRLMCFNLKVYGFNIRLVNVYAHTETAGSINQKDLFYRSLLKACERKGKHQKLLVIGDFNATTALGLQNSNYDGSQIMTDEICNDNGARLKSLCRSKRLCMASSFFDYPLKNRFTWYSPDQRTKKKNDYVLTEKFVQQFIKSCKAEPDIDFDSDHRILITELLTPMTRRARWKKKESKSNPKPNIALLKDAYVRSQFQEKLRSSLQNETLTADTTDQTSCNITKTLNDIADATIPKVKRHETKQIWKEDKELNNLLNKRMKITTNTQDYKNLTKLIKKRVKDLRNQRLKDEADAINEFANKRKIEELFKKVKMDNSAFKNLHNDKRCDPGKLKEFFQQHFNKNLNLETPMEVENAQFINVLNEIPSSFLDSSSPKAEEVLKTIKSLKQGKSAVDVPTEYIKVAIENKQFLNEIVQLYQTVWKTKSIPKQWGHSKLVAIWKGATKGSVTDEKAYRGLQIGSSLCKILIVIIIKRIQKWYELQLTDEQQGFRRGRGTTDGIYIAKRIQQLSYQKKTPVYALFIDLTAAFDHIPRKIMFATIKQRLNTATSKQLIELLEVLYQNTTTSLAEAPEKVFETKSGVRQGGPESPMLFNLYIDFVMRSFLNECNEKDIKFTSFKYRIPESASKNQRESIGNIKTTWIGYADDLILLFENKVDLQCALTVLNSKFAKFGLAINVSKTKTMVFNSNDAKESYPEVICKLNGKDIKNVKSFIYLGSNLNYDESKTGTTEIELRIDSAESALYKHAKKFFNHNISLKTRVRIMNAIVRSRLTYGCQTWALTSGLLQRIKVTYSSILRKMTKGGFRRKKDAWSFALSNDAILKLCGTEDIELYIRRQQRNYLAHVVRNDDDTLCKKLTFDDHIRRPGRHISMETMVHNHEMLTRDRFNTLALNRVF